MVVERLQNLSKSISSILSRGYLKISEEKSSLITFLFHGIFRNEAEIRQNEIHPQQGVTIDHFRLFIEYYLNHGYEFISPDTILSTLEKGGKYILVTFDDGYYNNIHILPLLKVYKVPAVFFVTVNPVLLQKSFWWDVLYREGIKRGSSIKELSLVERKLKLKTHEIVEKYINDKYGKKAFDIISDIDRPFTSSELKDFSREHYVYIGNHTMDHAVLTNYSLESMQSQILDAQNSIFQITGKKPVFVSYPNGNYNMEIVKFSQAIGLELGITVCHKKNYLPLKLGSEDKMQLGRFVLEGNSYLIKQCEMFRSDFIPYYTFKNLLMGSC